MDLFFSYNSIDNVTGAIPRPLGLGWRHSYGMSMSSAVAGYATLVEEDGRRVVFKESSSGIFYPMVQYGHVGASLQKFTDNTFRLTREDGTLYSFNASGGLTSITSRPGNRLNLGYTGGNLTSLTDSYGRVVSLGYAGSLLTSVRDPLNRVTSIGYDNAGYLRTVTDPAFRTTFYNYDTSGRLSSRIDPTGKTILYGYDPSTGYLVSATDNATNNVASVTYYPDNNAAVFHQRNGYSKTVVYDPVLDLPVQVIQADNTSVVYSYDNSARLLSIAGPGQRSLSRQYGSDNTVYETDASGRIWVSEYNPYKQLTRFTDPLGRQTAYHYDSRGILDWVRNAAGETTYFEVNVDLHGKVTAVTDPRGRRSSITYDVFGYPAGVTDNTGLTTSFVHDNVGNLLRVTDASGIVTQYAYDNVNRLTQVTYNNGSSSHVTYAGNWATYTDANGHATSVEYLEGSKPTAVVDALNRLTQYGYSYGGCASCSVSGGDLLGRVANANGHLFSFEYDPMDRLSRVVDPTDNQTVYSYHPEGTLQGRMDAKGRAGVYGYDPVGNLTQMVNALSSVTLLGRGASGLLDNVIDGKGYVTLYAYDNVGRVVQVASWDSGTTDYSYYADGTLHTRTDGRDITTTYSYDTSGRLTQVLFPDASENRSYSYDNASLAYGRGRLTGESGPWGSAIYQHDSMGRLSSEGKTILGRSYATSYAYDNVGNLTSMTYPSGRVVSYSYNAVNKPTLVQWTRQGTTQTVASSILYDNVDHLTQMTLGNGIVESRGYDGMDRLSAISAPPALSLGFAYDSVGNIVEVSDNVSSSISPALGITSYSYTANRLDNVIEGSSIKSYAYDLSGNTTSDGALTFQYNQDGRLKKALQGATTVGEYLYDGKGHRVIKTAGGQTKVFHYDPLHRLIAETDSGGNLLVEYLYLEDRPLAQLRPSGSNEATYYYHTDQLGTPKTLTNASQAIVWSVPLEEFGNELASGVRTVENPLRFPGQYYDQETGLHQNYFRDYDPKTGRYIEPDPIGQEGGGNLYPYVGGNSCSSYTDPEGLVAIPVRGGLYSRAKPSLFRWYMLRALSLHAAIWIQAADGG